MAEASAAVPAKAAAIVAAEETLSGAAGDAGVTVVAILVAPDVSGKSFVAAPQSAARTMQTSPARLHRFVVR